MPLYKSIATLCTYGGRSLDLLTPLIREEVERTVEQSTLFRGSDWTPKLITETSLLLGKDFISRVLSGPFTTLSNMISNGNFFEVNPNLCEPSLLSQNLENLLSICNSFLSSIIDNVPYLPKTLKNICKQLYQETKEKFPNSKDFIIGGFFFLRFICPAVISPRPYVALNEPIWSNASFKRAVILISKVLQNLSNGVVFGKKELFMEPFNVFIQSNLPHISNLFNYLCEDENLCPDDSLMYIDIDHRQIENLGFFICFDTPLVISEMLPFSKKDLPAIDEEIERIQKFIDMYKPNSPFVKIK